MPSYAFLWRTSDFSMEVGETVTITLSYPNKGGDSIPIFEDGVQIGTTTTNTYDYTPTSNGTHILHYFNTNECSPLTVTVTGGGIVSGNDTTTLNGALTELGETMATNITAKGVSASANDGLTTLVGKISQIQTGGGGGCVKLVQGTFTTGSTRATSETLSINYNGNGYPIAVLVYMKNGPYNPDDTWYNTISQWDADAFYMIKSQMGSTPTFLASTSLPQNQGTICVMYKSSVSNATTHTRAGIPNAVFFNSENAKSGYNCVRFTDNTTTMTYYIGNNKSNSFGLAPSKEYAYIVIYSE